MVIRRISALVLIVLAGSACSVLKVSTGGKSVDGVPFYVKTATHTQETAYRHVDYHIVVELTESLVDKSPSEPAKAVLHSRKIVLGELEIPADVFESDAMGDLRESIREFAGSGRDDHQTKIDAITTALSSLESERRSSSCTRAPRSMPDASYKANCLQLLRNTVVRKIEVDTAQTYYLNARHPWNGKGSLEYTLAADQTLTAGKAEVEDKSLETLLGLFPVAEFLTGKYVTSDDSTVTKMLTADPNAPKPKAPEVQWSVALTVEPEIWVYTLSKPLGDPGQFGTPLDFSTTDKISIVITPPGTSAPNPDAGKNAGGAFAIEGKVTLKSGEPAKTGETQ